MELILAAAACNNDWDWPGVAGMAAAFLFFFGVLWLLLTKFF
jgi:hypothetical protein